MCRLFGMASLANSVAARFWLLDADDSLLVQSHREPDGWGLGWYDPPTEPQRFRDPRAAWQDDDYTSTAAEATSTRFIAHVRYASTGAVEERNTHPFEQRGRMFAHNGVVSGLDLLRERLGPDLALVHGSTDSELTFALLTSEIERANGDVAAGIIAAGTWIAEHLPVFAWNFVLITPSELYALRWPARHELWWLHRGAGGVHGSRTFMGSGMRHPLSVGSGDLVRTSAVVVASEPMDEDPGWQQLQSGELLAVSAAGELSVQRVLAMSPRFELTEAELDAREVASQQGGISP
ncbi:MAG: class II glutamine amidotransferase [Gaiellales bacterium]